MTYAQQWLIGTALRRNETAALNLSGWSSWRPWAIIGIPVAIGGGIGVALGGLKGATVGIVVAGAAAGTLLASGAALNQ